MTIKSFIPEEFCDSQRNRFDSHAYFKTVNHHHIADYGGDVTCDLKIVECENGTWFIEDNWAGDAKGAADVFNPFDKNSFPTFFSDLLTCNLRAAEIVSAITGCNIEQLMFDD